MISHSNQGFQTEHKDSNPQISSYETRVNEISAIPN